ncbi:MAG: tetratricopeptide repeat protein [Candidatus Hodarchaeota archaeon]
MKTCPYCKNIIEDHWKYCYNCNKPLITNIENDLSKSLKSSFIEPLHYSTDLEELEGSYKYYEKNIIDEEEIERKIQEINEKLKQKEDIGEPIPGSLLLEKSSLYYKKRDLSSALKNLELASKNFKEEKDLLNEAICYNEIGIIQEDLGFFDQAIYHFNRALEILKDLNEYQKAIKTLNNLGNVYYLINDLEHSYKYYQEALNLSEHNNLITEEIKSASNLVEVLLILKDVERIKKILSRNSKFFKEREDIYGMIQTHIKYGKFYYILGEDYDQAFQSINNALGLINRIEDKDSMYIKAKLEWECFLYLGKLYLIWDNMPEAENLLLKSLEAVRIFEIAEDIKEGIVLENLAKLYELKGEYLKSIEYYNFSIEIYEKYGDKPKIAKLKTVIAHLYSDFLNDNLKAIKFFESALSIFEDLEYIKESADIFHTLGDIALEREENDIAFINFEKAKNYYKELQDDYNENIVHEKINSISKPKFHYDD